MLKSTVIAHCLVNANTFSSLIDAESEVEKRFIDEFPDKDINFTQWNTEMDDSQAENVINNLGRAPHVNIRLFILELWR